ncbi:MAG TPA: division/cell wall cluster transcriptional repressor MraZ [Nitrospinota bacterium]|jgi:MraZ protein|nr:cell division/cell wall cluster transcriptional repressor MraZ [Anaerolineaceae bacterium]HJM83592.1 division/cell wall cluster transcriptional repressor MraZ [Nitrospinota bacterium]|tara:strand:- start:22859 stop:23287 length:429 start_codon:yes stop_codon:yes gene_type:complete
MFIGHSSASVDPKGRVHLPSKFRDVLVKNYGRPLILTISDRCLAGYPSNYWLERYEALAAAEYTPEKGDLLRAITENAEECPIKNGRILLPARLRKYAGIGHDVVIVGRIKMIEIWSKEIHAEISGKYDTKALSVKLREIGF